MSSNLYFSKRIKVLNDKISSCINDISSLFDGIENLDKSLSIKNTDETWTEDLYAVLAKLSSLLSDSPDISEFIFPHLEEIRKQNAIGLLETSPKQLNLTENSSLSNVNDIAEQTNHVWYKICAALEQYASTVLNENYNPSASLQNHFNLCLLKNFVLRLQYIYIPEIVWKKYKEYRKHYLECYTCQCPISGSCFNCCLKLCIQCIYEDEFLINIGCFHTHIITQSIVLDTYSDFINKKFYKFLKFLAESLSTKRSLNNEVKSILDFSNSHTMHSQTCFSCFIQKRIETEIDSAVYCIDNNYGTESVWNVMFIGLVIKIVEALTTFEDRLLALFHKKHIKHHTHCNQRSLLVEGSKLVLATESPENSPFSKASLQKSAKKNLSLMEGEKILLLWNWRLTLVENGYISNLQRLLQNDVEHIIKTLIEREKKALKCNQWMELLKFDKEINFTTESVQTNTLLHSVFSTVQTLEKYLPVLETSCESFISFKSSFYHALETYVINLIKHLKEIAEHVKDSTSIYYEYIAINNAIFLRNRLQHYCDLLQGCVCESSPNNICHSITQLGDDLIESVHLHLFRYVSCSILFDADSHHFGDPKPFFEGERISYSIQMWNFFMKGLLHDLKYFLPQNTAQEIYAKVLSSSLELFLARYSHCTPSEARTPQLSCDIHAILLSTSELLWPACSSVSQFIGRKLEMEEDQIATSVNKTHSSCCFLLSVLVTLVAPISELHRAFKDGFPQARLSVRTKYESVSPWLPWIRRELFSEFSDRQIVSNVSVWLAVKSCTLWNVPNPSSIIKAFIEHNCTLSIMLMMQATASPVSPVDSNVYLSSLPETAKVKLSYSLLELLICFDNHSHLQDILFPVIEKMNGWQEFDKSTISKITDERSWWYISLSNTLSQYMNSVFEELMPFWLEVSKKCEDSSALKSLSDLKDSLKDYVVCVCVKDEFNFLRDEFILSDEIVSFVCLKKVLESMHKNLASLPQPLKCFLLSLDLHVSNYVPEVQAINQSVPLQVLLSTAYAFLQDPKFNNTLSNELEKMAMITADAICKADDFQIDDNYTKTLTLLMSSIHGKFYDLKKDIERISENMYVKEIMDELLEITAHKLLQLPHGSSTILYLHRILCQNESWIQRSLGVPGMLSLDIVVNLPSPSPLLNTSSDLQEMESKESPAFKEWKATSQAYIESEPEFNQNDSIDSDCKKIIEKPFTNFNPSDVKENADGLTLDVDSSILQNHFQFNPLEVFDKLGESSFTQIAMDPPILHWEALLSHLPVLGLTEVNFSMLLSQRWDIRNEGPLTAEEIKCVEELKAAYKLEH